MKTNWISLSGKLVRGHRVASGPSKDYPYGTIEKQRPVFKSLGLDLGDCFNGTLNIDIRPQKFEIVKPQYTFEKVVWTDLHPPETFSFSRCQVIYHGLEYDGWIYYPHPETKRQHFQNESLLEVIALPIPEIKYGDGVEVIVNGEEISVA
ncbi:MAG: hypothetical protein R6W69_01755 [Anaerolineales bacterium]